jgi:hypothetical protein
MGAFFSGTDTKELKDNAKSYNYYISLVVDFKEEYKCKIVFPSKSTTTYMNKIKDLNGNTVEIPVVKEEVVLLEGDLSIEMITNNTVDTWVQNRLFEIQEKKRKELATTYPVIGTHKTYPSLWDYKEEITPMNSLNKIEEFFIELITFGSNKNYDFKTALNDLKSLNEDEIKIFIDDLDSNIAILHFNIFGEDEGYYNHITSVIEILNKYKHKNILTFIEFLEGELDNE